MTKDPTLTKVASLKGIRVGVQNGTTQQQYLQTEMPQINTVAYPNAQNAMNDLKVGRVQAIFADMAVVSTWMKQNKDLHLVGTPMTNEKFFGKGFGIAVNKGKPELVKELNQALQAIKANGSYDKIYQHYFG